MSKTPTYIFSEAKKLHVLFAPLDWGLGHATRCIPLIKMAIANGHKVSIAADKRPLALLQVEFPELNFIRLKGYNITYPTGASMVLKMGVQLPKIVLGIIREHFAIAKLVKQHGVDIVISDNRYGLWGAQAQHIFITHQLFIPTGFLEQLVNYFNRWFIERYHLCWIPDWAKSPNLSGKLSHQGKLPKNAVFIGPLSRFKRRNLGKSLPLIDVLAILSGPEPQRTIFENIILKQFENSNLKCILVRGMPGAMENNLLSSKVDIYKHLSDSDLETLVANSAIILSRSGYSTVMDLAVMKSKVIFVPTPGQTEQYYLAEQFSELGIAPFCEQDDFDLHSMLQKAKSYSGFQ